MTDTNLPAEEAETPIEEIVPEQASEQPEEAPEATGDPDPEPAPAAAQAEPDDKSLPYWARQRVKAEKERTRALEREVEALRGQRPAQQPMTLPDPYEAPEDFGRAVIGHAEQVAFNNHLNTSEMIARDRHGDQAVDEMLEWLGTRPDIGKWAMGQRNPYGAAIQQYQRDRFADEIGNDPEAWKTAERERIRQEVLAETQGGQPQQHRPFTPAPASQARSARPNGQWSGPTPIKSALKNDF
jgi:hypothetical protein